MPRSTIDTHVLDHLTGGPASGMHVKLERLVDGSWVAIGEGVTDEHGRETSLTSDGAPPGSYRLVFAVGDYYATSGSTVFFPRVVVEFEIPRSEAERNYHVPILVTPHWYSTYLGV